MSALENAVETAQDLSAGDVGKLLERVEHYLRRTLALMNQYWSPAFHHLMMKSGQ